MTGLSLTPIVPSTLAIDPAVLVRGKAVNAQEDFAAKADGVSDDSAAIQAALDYVSGLGGGTVYLPPGTYVVGSTIIHPSNVTLCGTGLTTIIKGVFALGTAYIIQSDSAVANVNIGLQGITIDRSGANAQHALHYRNVNGLVVTNCRVQGRASVMSGGMVFGGFTAPSGSDQVQNVRVTNCSFSETDNFAVQFGWVNNGVIANNTAENCYREVFAVEPGAGATSTNVTIVGNVARQGTWKQGLSSATGVIIVTESSGGTVRNVTITGNSVLTSTSIASDTSPGIAVYGCQDVAVSGNTVNGANGNGIRIGNTSFASSYITVSGNSIKDCNQGGNSTPNDVGIAIRNTTKSIITGNAISGTAHRLSLEETNSAASNVITNNLCLDAQGAFGTLGTNSVYFNNQTTDSSSSVDVRSSMAVFDGKNIAFGSTTGTKLGTVGGASGQKLGFYGSTPIVQPLLATGASHTVDDVITVLQSLGLTRQS